MSRDFEQELVEAYWITEKIQSNSIYAQNFYAALCNTSLCPIDNIFDILREETWGCSWRYAGGIVSEYRENESYADWYCSGMTDYSGYVPESHITDEIQDDVNRMGWKIVPL